MSHLRVSPFSLTAQPHTPSLPPSLSSCLGAAARRSPCALTSAQRASQLARSAVARPDTSHATTAPPSSDHHHSPEAAHETATARSIRVKQPSSDGEFINTGAPAPKRVRQKKAATQHLDTASADGPDAVPLVATTRGKGRRRAAALVAAAEAGELAGAGPSSATQTQTQVPTQQPAGQTAAQGRAGAARAQQTDEALAQPGARKRGRPPAAAAAAAKPADDSAAAAAAATAVAKAVAAATAAVAVAAAAAAAPPANTPPQRTYVSDPLDQTNYQSDQQFLADLRSRAASSSHAPVLTEIADTLSAMLTAAATEDTNPTQPVWDGYCAALFDRVLGSVSALNAASVVPDRGGVRAVGVSGSQQVTLRRVDDDSVITGEGESEGGVDHHVGPQHQYVPEVRTQTNTHTHM